MRERTRTPDELLAGFSSIAAAALGAPAAILSSVDEHGRRSVGCTGLELPRDDSGSSLLPPIQSRLLERPGTLLVPDVTRDERVRSQLAGVPFEAAAWLGVRARRRRRRTALSVIDQVPRPWSDDDVAVATAVAGAAITSLDAEQDLDELRLRERRYRSVLRAASTAVWEWNLHDGSIAWDGEAVTVLRCDARELGSAIDWWFERVHPDERARVVRGLMTAVNGDGGLWADEHRFRRSDGTWAVLLMRCLVLRGRHGAPERVIGGIVDVTERAREEHAQRFLAYASELLDPSLEEGAIIERLARIAVPELAECCMIDLAAPGGRIRRAAASHADGARLSLLRRDGCFEADTDAARFPIVRAIRTGQPVLVPRYDEAQRQRLSLDLERAGTPDALDIHAFMVLPMIARERVIGALTLAASAPDRQYSPAELMAGENLARRAAVAIDTARLHARTQDAVHAREEVLRLVSHDLRNPIDAIQLTAALLLDSEEERRQETVDRLQLIRRVALRMNDLIEDLLDASVMQDGGLDVERTEWPVSELLADAAELVEPLAETKRIRLSWHVGDVKVRLNVDEGQILRVFSNLIGNAIKFTPEGGSIDVVVEEQGEDVCFSIRDTGPGIPEAELPNVFKRYWQGRHGDRRGAGLGLVIARGIVEAHGGRIRADSRPGEGATFTFTLPRAG